MADVRSDARYTTNFATSAHHPGRNYTVRLSRPRAETLNRTWKFPEPQPVR
jgi:hypothetical protein